MSQQKLTKIPSSVQRSLDHILQMYPLMNSIVDKIVQGGGRVFLVGGAVRDLFLGLAIKDLDCEIHNLSIDQLETILKTVGPVSLVGKIYGVLRVHNLDVDWSVPRKDAGGRKPKVEFDVYLTIEQAFRRRDLTMNAMGIDLKTFELIDPFNGLEDLNNKILRTPDAELFVEDPLRFYRVMQFIGRFEMFPDNELNQLCKTMNLNGVSKERIAIEFEKLFLKSKRPSLGIRWLYEIGRLSEILPELAATVGIKQNNNYHPEGDVFEHTMQAVDAAAVLEYESQHDKLTVIFATLCHDLGKVDTTEIMDGKITSYGHDESGMEPTKKLMKRITLKIELMETVEKLVRYHMAPIQFVDQNASLSAYKKLAKKLYPQTNLQLLAKVSLADKRGRNDTSHEPLKYDIPQVDEFLKKAEKARVQLAPEPPVLQGKDLLDVMSPGPQMGAVLDRIYQIQIEDNIHDKQELKKRALQIFHDLNRRNKA